MENEIVFTKEEFDRYNTRLLRTFVEYLNNQHRKTKEVFHCGVQVQIIDKDNLVKDFVDKLELAMEKVTK